MFIAKIRINLDDPLRETLKSIYGIGKTRLKNIYLRLGSSKYSRILDLPLPKRRGLEKLTAKWLLDKELKKKEVSVLVSHLKTGSYKGIRFRQGLPANGQRTHSNASTARRKLQIVKLFGYRK